MGLIDGLVACQTSFLALEEQGFHGRKLPVLFLFLGLGLRSATAASFGSTSSRPANR
jgi:hypothetical protein